MAEEPGEVLSGRNRRTFLVAAWVGATLLGLALAATTRIGPVLFVLSRNHGVHLGDLVAFAVVYAVVLVITLRNTRAR
ncbi:hypothetical protein [Pseudonocardia sp. MH-G8]|uniref:hypothetical protein n=1 Tax=Pseudonocardia sp. MH-G8 TaxID=1854588 RepID=UPI000BA09730|nr:hypothetical protein [Pseudonocardia sp. MH-G8]OZM81729.1 hypothetical protein CFP66_12270 [Pseudonocardia sp. MH-G8]